MKSAFMSGVAAIAIIAAGGAYAADLPATIPAPLPVSQTFDWTGFYLGGHVGIGNANFDGGMELRSAGSEVFMSDLNLDGIAGGIHGGYNWQVDSWVFGIEADLTLVNWDDRVLGGGSDSLAVTGDVDLLASVRGRIGIAFDRALVFATGGIAFANADAGIFNIGPGSTDSAEIDLGAVGGVVGGGLEWAVTNSVAVRIEGLYYFFNERESAELGVTNTDTGDFAEFENAFVVRIGANYHFSDMRLKRDVALLSRLENGIGLYRYRYLWSEEVYVGVMAQETAKIVPDAVMTGPDGYLRVDYERLGRKLMTWDEWIASSISELAIAA